MAGELAEQLDLPHIALDSILFTEHGPLPLDEFRAKAADMADGGAWIVEGNFSKLADVVWRRADVLVWLDYRLPVIVWRIVRRSLRQLTGLESSPESQRLTWRRAFFARRSVLRNAIRKYRNNRPRYARQIDEAATFGVRVLRFRNPTDAQGWAQQPHIDDDTGSGRR